VSSRYLTPLMTVLAGCLTWGPARADVMGCLVEPDRVADVGSQSVGVLEQVYVERGDQVVSGQLMARLSAGVERASVSVAEARSRTEAELKQAMASSELAQRKLSRARDLLKREFVSDQAVDQAEAEARVAEQRVAQAREAQLVAQREYKLSAAQLGQRDVRSPFGGVVVERYRTEGERIEREPLVRVAKIDPLRVEAIVPAAQFGSIAVGQSAIVKTDLSNFSAMSAKVVLVDRVIDPASNSFRVRLTLPNPDHKIPSGLRCKVDFAVAPSATPAAPLPGAAKAELPLIKPARAVLPSPAGGRLPAARVVNQDQAPERQLVKQYMASREPRLTMSNRMTAPRPTSLDGERIWLSLR
jgi:cobalt-zinc-cadmium efflux system membrane fusion protein